MLFYSLTLSLATLLIGAIERYLAITKPIYHRCKVTMRRIVYATLSVWVISFLVATIFTIPVVMARSARAVFICLIAFGAVMLGIIIFVLAILLKTLSTAKASCRSAQRCAQKNKDNKSTSSPYFKKRVRLVTIFLSMMIFYVVTFLPMIMTWILICIDTLTHLPDFDLIVVDVPRHNKALVTTDHM